MSAERNMITAQKALDALIHRAFLKSDPVIIWFLLSCMNANAHGGFDLLDEASRIADKKVKLDMATVYEYEANMNNKPILPQYQMLIEELKARHQSAAVS